MRSSWHIVVAQQLAVTQEPDMGEVRCGVQQTLITIADVELPEESDALRWLAILEHAPANGTDDGEGGLGGGWGVLAWKGPPCLRDGATSSLFWRGQWDGGSSAR